ncbi:copper transporter [Bacillus sp. WMMC1349]|uniref:copper resistance CopC/CopD family protein n=1 Tax=Bacillus sp. WMMC1349 TaxID=2736254 RepID=UPI001551A9B8|nr:copper resistance CopC/CopD family protein [Bacillus sp. WMMC1349]NPC91534.1 copper transporter [Bacillus sp. WMMC1349]
MNNMVRKKATLWIMMIVCFFIIPKTAFAHAYIVNSTPLENQELNKAPSEIKLEFNEVIQEGFHSIIVRDSSGERVDQGQTIIDPKNAKVLKTKLQQHLKDDIYSAEWRAVSADGHPVSGTIPFSVGKIQGSLPKGEQSTAANQLPKADTIIERVLLYTGFSFLMGLILFQLVWYRPIMGLSQQMKRRIQRLMKMALVLIGAGLLIQLPLQTKANAGVAWNEAFQPNLLKETLLYTTGGTLWMINIGLLIVLFVFTWKTSYVLNIIPLIGLLFVKSLSGHAASTSSRMMTIILDFVHLGSASVWVGGLAVIALLFGKDWVKSDRSHIWEAIRRFSPWALCSAGLLVFSGFINSFFIVHTLNNLFTTYYGKALLIKLALFCLMIGLGTFHYVRFRKKPKHVRAETIKAEWLIGLLILMTTAVFTNIPSPHAPLPLPFNETKQLENGETLSLGISPNIPGSNTFEVRVRNRNGEISKDIQKIELTISKTSLFGDKQESTFNLAKNKQGIFRSKYLNMNEEGLWKIRVHGLTASFTEIKTVFNVKTNKKEY